MAFVPQTSDEATVRVEQAAPDRMTVSGALTFATARGAYDAGLRVVRSGSTQPLHVDCAGVTDSDSAGLAVLIEWLAQGARIDRKVTFANVPHGIRAAAKISDVEFLFG